MKKIFLALAALALTAWGCSGNDDNDENPVEKGFPFGTVTRPAWRIPNFDDYDLSMIVDITLQDTLQSYASYNDLLCATINDEVRGLAEPEKSNNRWRFLITVASDESGQDIKLSYYCDSLHRIFTTNWIKFDSSIPPTGKGEVYVPVFVK